MRIVVCAAAALTLLVALVGADSAAAATQCTYPPSAYSTGAPWDVTNPGPQPVNDPIFPDQWGLTQIKAPAAWARGDKGAGVTIAVLDTGADLNHPDLQANLVPGADLTPADEQGCPGPQDENGHGTHTAGIAAAVTNNGIGVAGTAPDAKVMPVRVLGADGSGDQSTIVQGIKYAADHGAKVISMSLGEDPIVGQTPLLNQDLQDAVDYAFAKGAVVVAAAGNETFPLCSYPSFADRAICVGATDKRGLPSYYSNFPNKPDMNIGVRAPGGVGSVFCEDSEDIWSTIWPGGESCNDTSQGDLSGYDTLAGTSMATPYVSGVAAMLSGKGLTNAQILQCLKTTSSNKGAYDPVMGYGIVDADAATATCSPTTTAAFVPPATGSSPVGGSTGGGGTTGSTPAQGSPDTLTVRVSRTTLRKLARTRKLKVTVTSSKAVTVRLRAVTSGRHRKTLARGRVALSQPGSRRVTLRLSRRSARSLAHSRRGGVAVLYSGGGHAGTASAG